MPARNIRRWEAISASLGVSRRLGRKKRDRRMEVIGVPESVWPGSQAATARQTQARRVPNLEQRRCGRIFLFGMRPKLMTSLPNSITTRQLSPCRELERDHLGIAVQVLGGWPSEREPNAAAPP